MTVLRGTQLAMPISMTLFEMLLVLYLLLCMIGMAVVAVATVITGIAGVDFIFGLAIGLAMGWSVLAVIGALAHLFEGANGVIKRRAIARRFHARARYR